MAGKKVCWLPYFPASTLVSLRTEHTLINFVFEVTGSSSSAEILCGQINLKQLKAFLLTICVLQHDGLFWDCCLYQFIAEFLLK